MNKCRRNAIPAKMYSCFRTIPSPLPPFSRNTRKQSYASTFNSTSLFYLNGYAVRMMGIVGALSYIANLGIWVASFR